MMLDLLCLIEAWRDQSVAIHLDQLVAARSPCERAAKHLRILETAP